jgi:hypothetical protein
MSIELSSGLSVRAALMGCLALGGEILSAPDARAQGSAAAFTVPTQGLYIGAGGSLNVSSFGSQNVYAVGLSDVYQNGVRVSSGSAAGPASVNMGSTVGVAPSAQIGYFRNFAESQWLWGLKASYSYLGASVTREDVRLPQAGSFTYASNNQTVPFTGNAVVRSYQARAEHQIALTPFIGRSYERGFLYLGGGPTLTRLQTNLNGLVGFADINGNRSDVSGAPQNFQSAGWVWGGMLLVGATYFINSSWFLDLNYTVAATQRQTGNYYSTFTNASGIPGSVTTGQLIGNSAGAVVTQGATVTLNYRF